MRQICWCVGVGVMLALPASARAQSVGVEGGLSLSTLKSQDDEADFLDRLVAPTGGLFVVFGPNAVTGRIDVLYSVRGAKFELGEYRFTYLEIPVGAQIHVARTSNSDVHIFGGTSLGIKLDAKLSQTNDADVELDDEVEDLDLGIYIGAGVTFGRFVVNGRYTHGVRNISVGGPELKNRSFAFMVGFRLN
ncbi:MAG TPA: porin family protein [Vicinamibacterales bacterium]|nr:porin family protein [Vicinamibacterales bacterium]